MAYELGVRSYTVDAAADLSSSQFCLVTINSSGQAGLTAAAGLSDGIVQNKPTSGTPATVCFPTGCISKAVASAAITAGDQLGCAGSGQVRTATTNDNIVGKALASASGANVIIPVLLYTAGLHA